MIEFLSELDTKLFLFLNGIHSSFFDIWMFRITNKVYWIPFFVLLIIALTVKFKKESLWIILGAIVCVSLSDLVVSGMMKPFFERLRPSRDPELEGLVHLVNGYKGGRYSFASGHAATSFALATFLWMTVRKSIPSIWIVFVWSVLFSYSRIYLGVHYPGDIITGALIGSFIAWLAARAYFAFLKYRRYRNTTSA